jgi:hypothetical protein
MQLQTLFVGFRQSQSAHQWKKRKTPQFQSSPEAALIACRSGGCRQQAEIAEM